MLRRFSKVLRAAVLAGAIFTSSPVCYACYYGCEITWVNQTTDVISGGEMEDSCGDTSTGNGGFPMGGGASHTEGWAVYGDGSGGCRPTTLSCGGTYTFLAFTRDGQTVYCNPPTISLPSSSSGVALTVYISFTPPSTCQTNVATWTGCLQINNSGSLPQYYQFQVSSGGCYPQTLTVPSSSPGLLVDGQYNQCGDPNSWFICGPGESHQVCVVQVPLTNVTGCQGCAGGGPALQAVVPAVSAAQCDISVCTGWTDLCNDGNLYAGANVPVFSANLNNDDYGIVSNTVVSNAPSGIQYSGSTSNIIWSADTNDPAQNLTVEQGFSALYDAAGYQLRELDKIDQDVISSEAMLAIAISNSKASVTLSNLILTNINMGPTNTGPGSNYVLNFPTNYPDSAAIGLLGVIATNLARSNVFDTNLEASATAIASNTAAPLAYTNLGITAYSTNPSDIVAYASNTLAGPVNNSMQSYAQSATDAAAAVTVGGSPGELLTISFDVPGVGPYTIDCNPMDNSDVADFASWFRGLMEWMVGLSFVAMVLRDGMQATRTALLSPQGQFPKLMVLGNSIGWPLAAVYVVAIVAAMVAVPFTLVTWFSVGGTGQMWWQEIAVNPFSGEGVGRAVGLSLWLADQFLPMSYIVSSMLYYIGFRFALNGIVIVAATIVRALMA